MTPADLRAATCRDEHRFMNKKSALVLARACLRAIGEGRVVTREAMARVLAGQAQSLWTALDEADALLRAFGEAGR